MTYSVTITIAVDEHKDEYLQGEQAIRDEVTSWLEGLGVAVQTVTVRQEEV